MTYHFSGFSLDIERRSLLDAHGHELPLRPQALNVLECLLEHAPAVVSREELLREVWGHEALSASGVSQAIREIRRVLGDSATRPGIVATRHGCGYQIVIPVTRGQTSGHPEVAAVPCHPNPPMPVALQPSRVSRRFSAARLAAFAGIPAAMLFGTLLTNFPGWKPHDPVAPIHSLDSRNQYIGERLPEQQDVVRQWRAGLEHWRDREWTKAIERMAAALDREPDATAVELDLIATYLDAGKTAAARELLSRSASRHQALSRQESLELRALLARSGGHADTALGALSSLASFFPDNLDYKFNLFDLQLDSAPVHDARETLESIRELLPEPETDARYQLASARLALLDGRIPEALGSAALVRDGLDAADGLRAQATLVRAAAFSRIGQLEQAGDMLAESMRLFQTLGDGGGRMQALLELARLDLARGQVDEAANRVDDGCNMAAQIGSRKGQAACHAARGRILLARQNNAEAVIPLETALDEFQLIGDRYEAAETLIDLGMALGRSGEIDSASDLHGEAEALARHLNSRMTIARVLMCRGDVYSMRQLPNLARPMYTEALVTYDSISARRGQVQAMLRLAAVQRQIGDDPGAGDLTRQAERLVADTQNLIATLDVSADDLAFSIW